MDVDKLSEIVNPNLFFRWCIRSSHRRFYGYVPYDVKRKVGVFSSLFSLSAFNLCVRASSCILIYDTWGFHGVATILGTELLLYFVNKVLRQDFLYWTPVDGGLGIFIAVMTRTVIKILADWTALIHFRHPNEVGGAYFTASLGLTIVMGIVTAAQYQQEEGRFGEGFIFISMLIGCIGMCLSYALLIICSNKSHRKSFISRITSSEAIQNSFKNQTEDEYKIYIFTYGRHKWEVSKEDQELIVEQELIV